MCPFLSASNQGHALHFWGSWQVTLQRSILSSLYNCPREYFEMHLSENTSHCPLTQWSDDSSHDSLWKGQVNLQKIYTVVRHTCPLKSLPLAVHWADPSLETSLSRAEQWLVALTVRVWTCEEFDALSFSISDAFSSLLFSQILRQRLCCRQLILGGDSERGESDSERSGSSLSG